MFERYLKAKLRLAGGDETPDGGEILPHYQPEFGFQFPIYADLTLRVVARPSPIQTMLPNSDTAIILHHRRTV